MKVLFEVPLRAINHKKSQFKWLNNKSNWLFVIEDGKRMKTLSSEPEPGKELQSATLAEAKICTSLSWNKDGNLLALVVDKLQIYFWEIETNNFTHFKPVNRISNNSSLVSKKSKTRDIELVTWSKLSNKLVICYSTGQILICKFDSNVSEKFIDNSDGVLRKISSIKTSDHIDLFVCVTIVSEVLVMTFNGETKFYIQSDNISIVRTKFSSPFEDSKSVKQINGRYSELQNNQSLWLAYQPNNDKIFLKKIVLDYYSSTETTLKAEIIYSGENIKSELINFYWLSSTHLIACFISGTIVLLQVKSVHSANSQQKNDFSLVSEIILNIRQEDDFRSVDETSFDVFKSFKLMSYDRQSYEGHKAKDESRSFSLAAITDYKLFYYELFEADSYQRFVIEKVDDLNLTGSLQKISLELARVEWCCDCSMLALQLTNGHIVIYRTRLQDYMVASYGPKTAYLSGVNEITILNYGPDRRENISLSSPVKSDSHGASDILVSNSNNALTINVHLKPSVIAVGPEHLAVALNNRVRFYPLIRSGGRNGELGSEEQSIFGEQEYVSIVIELSLCSRFVAVLFSDGRLKLHAIQSKWLVEYIDEAKQRQLIGSGGGGGIDDYSDSEEDLDERFFPDPVKPETITTFVLTEELFIYCTQDLYLKVFSLKDWTILHAHDHSEQFSRPIIKLKANDRGNKFICLMKGSMIGTNEDNVYLYDLYTNRMIKFFENNLYSRIFKSQLVITNNTHKSLITDESSHLKMMMPEMTTRPRLNRILDAIWDTDGRTVLLVERKCIHNSVAIDHTLEREETLIEYVATVNKASSYTTLYASHGIISFQTSLGRVINSISESHDDELKLTKLEQQIHQIKEKSPTGLVAAQAEIMKLKLGYLRTILPIYSLSKCKEICEHMMSDEQFNFDTKMRCVEIDMVLWRQLAAWAVFNMNLNFALIIYRKHGLLFRARILSEIINDARNKSLDAKSWVKTRLLVLLGCEIYDG